MADDTRLAKGQSIGGPFYTFPTEVRAEDHAETGRVEAYFRQFPVAPINPAALGPLLGLCFTNRSGSNYLAHILASTDQFNLAGEFFLTDTVLNHARTKHMRSLDDYLTFLRRTLARRGLLTAKLGLGHLVMLGEAGLLDASARLLTIEREDIIGQAISTAIAWQNQHWTSEHRKAIPDEALVYDRSRIETSIANIQRRRSLFQAAFRAMGITPFVVRYENLIEDPQAVMTGIGYWLDKPGLVVNPARIRIQRQANAINEAWRARYLAGE